MQDRVSDAELVERAEKGDRRAFEELVERHWSYVLGAAFAVLGDVDAADDAADIDVALLGADHHDLGALDEQVAARQHLDDAHRQRGHEEDVLRQLDELIPLTTSVRNTLEKAATRLALSPRAYHRVIKVARTIADLDDSPDINDSHVLEALQYRERKN